MHGQNTVSTDMQALHFSSARAFGEPGNETSGTCGATSIQFVTMATLYCMRQKGATLLFSCLLCFP